MKNKSYVENIEYKNMLQLGIPTANIQFNSIQFNSWPIKQLSTNKDCTVGSTSIIRLIAASYASQMKRFKFLSEILKEVITP